jgi:hypothetical protein
MTDLVFEARCLLARLIHTRPDARGQRIARRARSRYERRRVVPPDHRDCRCGHVGSVHDPAVGDLLTNLGYAFKGVGPCHGRAETGRPCPCLLFELREPLIRQEDWDQAVDISGLRRVGG